MKLAPIFEPSRFGFAWRRRGLLTAACVVISAGELIARAGDPAAGWCLKTDMNYDRQRNAADVDVFVTALLGKSKDPLLVCAGDADGNDVLDGADLPNFVQIHLNPDTDGDGIPDLFETDNGVFASATSTGTNPLVADTDGDAISDGNEVYDTVAGLDLHSLGASPVRKNIFIECDWFDESEDGFFHTHRPTATAIADLMSAFSAAPVPNPYGLPNGVTVIVDYGQGGVFTGGNLIPGGDTVVVFNTELYTYKAANFAANRNGFFHYNLHCHRYNTATNNSSGFAELPGDDLVVSLQIYLDNSNVTKTLMHELGHNLGLQHGGGFDRNFKPNYNSLMNYRYQFPGVDSDASCDAVGDGINDYSRGTRIALDETNLDEAAGVCGTVAVDWDGDTVISAGVARNINCYAGFSYPCGMNDPNLCYDTTCITNMVDYNDWANISFTGISDADFAAPEIVTCQDVPDSAKTPPR